MTRPRLLLILLRRARPELRPRILEQLGAWLRMQARFWRTTR